MDIEGLIAQGAPSDEYQSEAEAIKVAIYSVEGEVSADVVVAIMSLIWKDSFGLSDDDMVKRLPIIRRAAENIFGA
ncbi:hypothetical protein [Micavibrio aeruginosavorus]|uniref:Uncharacterized protein n=1 Tax=Micavibrio aeruginosavorus (strain ARL-13) TaxID=856793 RepID=G2KNI2_MICAA|nr:hypothetical protein [Micavibrio aeruginosavorus]AEP09830.1 hypothetical protein MICA_1512 [Micavibrio aeruginosavorus ARL-13]